MYATEMELSAMIYTPSLIKNEWPFYDQIYVLNILQNFKWKELVALEYLLLFILTKSRKLRC